MLILMRCIHSSLATLLESTKLTSTKLKPTLRIVASIQDRVTLLGLLLSLPHIRTSWRGTIQEVSRNPEPRARISRLAKWITSNCDPC
ncbi:hypothetical protein ASPFODRAFT_492263 [Aspergillus luchuensis CBS 106.47]|uniref:Uncharacterized protein n=1 Tax=Aspergillus luchuensis (strain CBS 106.47) TaxID=1137211 RepID=A0A1M3TRI9_ASPLC|nr:hypothetical protein ASPFODRAFT_492263 [Aspergillus luchuensis CBS 106.47]